MLRLLSIFLLSLLLVGCATNKAKFDVRKQTVAYKDFILNNGWVNSKTNGKMRLEGKDYIVKDGDVLNFRFNT